MGGSFAFVARVYWIMPGALLLWFVARWATKKDPAWMEILELYLKEEHIYDSIPRFKEFMKRPSGWGKGLPW